MSLDNFIQPMLNYTKTIIKYSELPPSSSVKFTRDNCLSPSDGLVVGNVDNIFYNYKTRKLMLVEFKSGSSTHFINKNGQWSIYRELDTALKSHHRNDNMFIGTFVVWTDTYQLDLSNSFKINGNRVSKQQFIDFLNLKPINHTPIDFTDFESYKMEMSRR